MAHVSDTSVLPRELAKLIADCLPPAARRSLCGASHHLGGLPTEELVTRLELHLPASDCCLQASIQQRMTRAIDALTISSIDAGDEASLPGLLSRVAPFLPQLRQLRFTHLSVAAVAGAAPVLAVTGTLCPFLTTIKLSGSTTSSKGPDPTLSHLPHLWPALAAVPTLRHLKVSHLPGDLLAVLDGVMEPASLEGVGILTQLHSLSLGRHSASLFTMGAPDVGCLVALTKLTLGPTIMSAAAGADDKPSQHLSALVQLQCLKLLMYVRAATPAEDQRVTAAVMPHLAPFGWCPNLTSLELKGCNGRQPSHVADFSLGFITDGRRGAVRPCYRALLRLYMDACLSCADLCALQALTAVAACGIMLPQAGSDLSLHRLHTVDIREFLHPYVTDGAGNVTWLPTQALPQTFPNVMALTWDGADWDGDPGVAVPGDLLPLSPAGRLTRLRKLTCHSLTTPFSSQCGGTVDTLIVVQPDAEHVDLAAGLSSSLLARFLESWVDRGPQLLGVGLTHPQLDDAGLHALVTTCPNIRTLSVNCEGGVDVTDTGVCDVGAALCGLQKVWLESCPAVTPAGVQALLCHPAVEHVQVIACEQVSAAEVDRLLQPPPGPNGGPSFGLRPSLNLVQGGSDLDVFRWWEGGNPVD